MISDYVQRAVEICLMPNAAPRLLADSFCPRTVIMRAFVELRRAAASYAEIERCLKHLERETQAKPGRHDQQLDTIFKALRELISRPPRPKRRIGFAPSEDDA
jgi:hypothetical protein